MKQYLQCYQITKFSYNNCYKTNNLILYTVNKMQPFIPQLAGCALTN